MWVEFTLKFENKKALLFVGDGGFICIKPSVNDNGTELTNDKDKAVIVVESYEEVRKIIRPYPNSDFDKIKG